MKRFLGVLVLLALVAAAPGASAQAPVGYGAAGALADTDITVAEALTYALQDEYLAQARYAAAIAQFGNRQPFGQIRKSEQRHVAALHRLADRHGLPVPEGIPSFPAVASLAQALEYAVTAEEQNVAMYEKLAGLPDLPRDARAVFLNQSGTSRKHLMALRGALRRVR